MATRRDERRPHVAEEQEQDRSSTRTAPSRSATETLRIATSMKSAWRKFSFSMTTPGGKRSLEVVQHAVDLPREGERVGARLLLDAQDHRRLARDRTPCPRAGSGASSTRRDLAEPQRDPVADAQHRRGEVGGRARPAEAADEVLLAPVDVEARGRDCARLARVPARPPRPRSRPARRRRDRARPGIRGRRHRWARPGRFPGTARRLRRTHGLRQPPQLHRRRPGRT